MYACMHACMYVIVCMHACTYVCMYVWLYVWLYVCNVCILCMLCMPVFDGNQFVILNKCNTQNSEGNTAQLCMHGCACISTSIVAIQQFPSLQKGAAKKNAPPNGKNPKLAADESSSKVLSKDGVVDVDTKPSTPDPRLVTPLAYSTKKESY